MGGGGKNSFYSFFTFFASCGVFHHGAVICASEHAEMNSGSNVGKGARGSGWIGEKLHSLVHLINFTFRDKFLFVFLLNGFLNLSIQHFYNNCSNENFQLFHAINGKLKE
jgi:hypothetical protein